MTGMMKTSDNSCKCSTGYLDTSNPENPSC